MVPGALERPERLIDMLIGHVARTRALDRRGRSLQREGAELADAGVELFVALSQRGRGRVAERGVRVAENLRDPPAVVLVVVLQAGEVHQRRPDVGLIESVVPSVLYAR